MVEWKDATSYSQGDKERIPRSWKAQIGRFILTVHRYAGCGGVWFASCHGLFETRELKSKDVDEAKCQAVAMLQVVCEEAIAVITQSSKGRKS